jgi:hypothetical protein
VFTSQELSRNRTIIILRGEFEKSRHVEKFCCGTLIYNVSEFDTSVVWRIGGQEFCHEIHEVVSCDKEY